MERDPVYPRDWLGWVGLPLRSLSRPMLGLSVRFHKPHRQVWCAICSSYPPPLSLPEIRSHLRHPPCVCLFQLSSIIVAWIVDQPHCLIYVGSYDHPIEEAHQHIQGRLEMGWSWWGQNPLIGILKSRNPLTCLYKTFWSYFLPCDYPHPVLYHSIHHHVKTSGWDRVSLGDSARYLEWGAIVSPHLVHHPPINVWLFSCKYNVHTLF